MYFVQFVPSVLFCSVFLPFFCWFGLRKIKMGRINLEKTKIAMAGSDRKGFKKQAQKL